VCFGGEDFRGHDQDDGEVSQKGIYLGQKKEEMRCKEIFGSFLSDEPSLGSLLCGSSLCRGVQGVVSFRL
jgi:hypothetical protein